MMLQIRLTRALYDSIRRDLKRPHEFAAERIGFLHANIGNFESDPLLVMLTDYWPVPDDQYVNDPRTGARINSTAIRTAMQSVLDRKQGIFHVHLHPHLGQPRPSVVDWRELPRLIASMQAVGPKMPHGIFLLSFDSATGFIWLPGRAQPIQTSKVSVVGFPMGIWT